MRKSPRTLSYENLYDYKNNYQNYLSSLPISESLRTILVDEDFIDQNPAFYLYYPTLFAFDSEIVDKSKVRKLCIAGYLYYQSTLFLDSVIDTKSTDSLIASMAAQEEAVKLLTDIYGANSKFWISWNGRKQEYFNAIKLEKKLSRQAEVSIDEYARLAADKATFGKAAIDAVYNLSNGAFEGSYSTILKSHDYFSVAFQMNDDIHDFKQDIESGQFNWAVHRMAKYNKENADLLKKLFYIDGHAVEVFKLAIDFLDKALVEVENIPIPGWKNEILKLKTKFQDSIFEVTNYLEILGAEVSNSTTKLGNNVVRDCLKKSFDFLKTKQSKNGSWKEYINQGGISDIWSTAFITSHLSEDILLKKIFSNEIASAIKFLKTTQSHHLWSYNETWMVDSDSTNFALLSFLDNYETIEDQTLNEWLNYFIPLSGFSTYKDGNQLLKSLKDPNISDVSGWVSVHQCVSAVALYFLVKSGKATEVSIELLSIFNELLKADKINSYWWSSEIYTYYYLLKAYSVLNDGAKQSKILNLVMEKYFKEGAIQDRYGTNLFYSGLVLEILITNQNRYKKEIDNLASYLLKEQYDDGSWENSHALQVPNPNTEHPYSEEEMFPVSTNGTSVRAKEFNRLFTTAVVSKGLFAYEQRNIRS